MACSFEICSNELVLQINKINEIKIQLNQLLLPIFNNNKELSNGFALTRNRQPSKNLDETFQSCLVAKKQMKGNANNHIYCFNICISKPSCQWISLSAFKFVEDFPKSTAQEFMLHSELRNISF
jgi:hypothetical protein